MTLRYAKNGTKSKITVEIDAKQKALLEAAGLNISEVVRISLRYYFELNEGALEQLALIKSP